MDEKVRMIDGGFRNGMRAVAYVWASKRECERDCIA